MPQHSYNLDLLIVFIKRKTIRFMKNLLDGIQETLLIGPGPSCVPKEVYMQ